MSVFDGARARTLVCQSEAIPTHLGEPLLHPVRLQGTEDLNSLFEYQLYLKTPDSLNPGAALDAAANLDLDAFIGREITCSIELDGAGEFVPGAVGASVDRVGAGDRLYQNREDSSPFLLELPEELVLPVLGYWPKFPEEWNSDCGQKRRESGIGPEEPLRWAAKV